MKRHISKRYEENVCRKLIDLGVLKEDFLATLPRYSNFVEGILSWGVSYEELSEAFRKEFGIDPCNVWEGNASQELIGSLPEEMAEVAKKYLVFPLAMEGDKLALAMSNPFDFAAIEDAALVAGCGVIARFANPEDIQRLLYKFYSVQKLGNIEVLFPESKSAEIKSDGEDVLEAPAVRLLNQIIENAVAREASDIHIEPFEKLVKIRYRIDGKLTELQDLDIGVASYLIARLKVISNLNTAEKRIPQDGHIAKGFYSDSVDFRISIMPTMFGEKAVIRIIYKKHSRVDKNSLGFFPEDMEDLSRIFNTNHGAVLVTGPTGSGKTTTLIAFLNELNKSDVNVVTIEEPVENIIHGVNQIDINHKTGLDFANSLRFILRQDPDIIMVGEIRDSDTASIAIQAALTGHLVLSTLHTNDAVGSIIRLIDMGVPDYLVAAALKCIISQRLLRKLCPVCKESVTISKEDSRILSLPETTKVFKAVGCSKCNNTGYHGRFAVYEYIIFDEKLRDLIHRKVDIDQMRAFLKANGMVQIRDNAKRNILLGNSTIEEMYKAVLQ